VRQCATVSLAQNGSSARFDPVVANVDLEIGPFPVVVQPRRDVSFRLGFNLLRDIAGDTVVKIGVTRNFIFNLRIPCVEVNFALMRQHVRKERFHRLSILDKNEYDYSILGLVSQDLIFLNLLSSFL
jgi:hypothetical protein